MNSWQRSTQVVQAEMAPGQAALLHLETGQYHALNEVGTRIWELLAEPCTLDQICALLCTEYAVDAERCATEVASYLRVLEGAHLIEPAT